MNAPRPQLSGKQTFVNLADASSTRKQIFVWNSPEQDSALVVRVVSGGGMLFGMLFGIGGMLFTWGKRVTLWCIVTEPR